MSGKRYILSTIAVFIFIFIFEMVVHGFALKGYYEATPSLWRPPLEMQVNMQILMLVQLIEAAWLTLAFSQFFKEGGLKNGLAFGLFFGVFAGILNGAGCLWLPVPYGLGLSWFLAGIGMGLGSGIILGILNRGRS